MSDEVDEGGGGDGGNKASRGLGGILKILMFVGIALGAVILIVTVVIITVNIINKSGTPIESVPMSEQYKEATPIYTYISELGQIDAETRDAQPASISVSVDLGVEENDKKGPLEITARKLQLKDFLRRYFSEKTYDELTPEHEDDLKEELREKLNSMLANPYIKEIIFEKFKVTKSQ